MPLTDWNREVPAGQARRGASRWMFVSVAPTRLPFSGDNAVCMQDQEPTQPTGRPAAASVPTGAPAIGAARLLDQVDPLDLDMLFHRERDRAAKGRRRRVLLIGVAASLMVHAMIMVVLHYKVRPVAGSGTTASVVIVSDSPETSESIESATLDELMNEAVVELEASPTDARLEAIDAAATTLQAVTNESGAASLLGGSGGDFGEVGGMTPGGAGTSFFGISSDGTRFAYIVDRSGSMGRDRRMETALDELISSIGRLPDYAFYYVILYSSDTETPKFQRGWMRALPARIGQLDRWSRGVIAAGGTFPYPAFEKVFGLPVRPDVIFFLTDGEIPPGSAELVRTLNRKGEPVVINTIAFGDSSSQGELQEIARKSGGRFRFVPTGSSP